MAALHVYHVAALGIGLRRCFCLTGCSVFVSNSAGRSASLAEGFSDGIATVFVLLKSLTFIHSSGTLQSHKRKISCKTIPSLELPGNDFLFFFLVDLLNIVSHIFLYVYIKTTTVQFFFNAVFNLLWNGQLN